MTDTPRTDAFCNKIAKDYKDDWNRWQLTANFAAELERELANLRDGFDAEGRTAAEACCEDFKAEQAERIRQLERELATITCEEGELWELRQENARLKDNLASLSKLHANEAEEWGKRENWRMSSVCRELRAELDRERALADRLANVLTLYNHDLLAGEMIQWVPKHDEALAAWKAARIDAHLDECIEKSAQSWKPLPGDPEQFYPR